MGNNSVPNEYLRVARVMKALYDDWQDQNPNGGWWCSADILNNILISDYQTIHGCSLEYKDNPSLRKVREHVVPRKELVEHVSKMYSKDPDGIEAVAKFLNRYLVIILVTSDERDKIDNHTVSYQGQQDKQKKKMPSDDWWNESLPDDSKFKRLDNAKVKYCLCKECDQTSCEWHLSKREDRFVANQPSWISSLKRSNLED